MYGFKGQAFFLSLACWCIEHQPRANNEIDLISLSSSLPLHFYNHSTLFLIYLDADGIAAHCSLFSLLCHHAFLFQFPFVPVAFYLC